MPKMDPHFVLLVVAVFFAKNICCTSIVNNKTMELHDKLLSYYNRDIRPCLGCTGPLSINLSFYLTSLNELDEVHGEMHTVGYLVVMWIEDRMTWNPLDYAGVTHVIFPAEKVSYKINSFHTNGIARALRKLCTPKRDYCIKHDSLQLHPFQNGNFS